MISKFPDDLIGSNRNENRRINISKGVRNL